MSNYINGTFNTVSYGELGEFGGGYEVWARIENRLAGGGYIKTFTMSSGTKTAVVNPLTGENFAAGDIIPAGTIVVYTKPGCELTIIPNSVAAHSSASTYAKGEVMLYQGKFYSAKAADTTGAFSSAAWNEISGKVGLIDNDVLIPNNAVVATAAVVVKGRIYADRVGNTDGGYGLPTLVEEFLPMIEFVREA